MRRALPLVVLLIVAAVAFLGWRQKWFVGADRTDDADGASLAPADIETRGDLKGSGVLRPTDADPKTYEGDPVGKLVLDFGTSGLSGRVVGADGTPIRFARVTVVLPPPDGGHSVRTTKEGAFEIKGLAASEYDLRVSADGFVSRSVRTPALVVGQTTAVGDVPLKAKTSSKEGIRVKATEEASGRPVPGAKVTVSTLNYALVVSIGAERGGITDSITRVGVTDDLGVCLFDGLPTEKYDVVVEAKGFVLEPVENVVVALGRVENVAVALKPGLSIQGNVVDADGLPVVGAFVTGLGFPSFRSYEAVQSEANGAFTLDGLSPGNYMLIGASDAKGTGSANPVKAGERAARIQLKGVGTVTGKVTTKGGGPVAEYVLRPYTAGPFQYVYSRLTHVKDPEGKFTLQLPPGAYQIDVKADGSSVTTTTAVTVTPNQTTDIAITLPPEGIVRGVVTDPDGNHLAGAEVYVKSGGFPPVAIREKYVRADGDGQFVLKGLALEPVTLHVRHAGFALAKVETTPVDAAKATELTVKLSAGARVEGHVKTKEGTPVAGERINLFQGFDFFAAKTAFTDDAGAFAFTAVGEGTYQCSTGRFEANAQGQQQGVTVPASGVVKVDFTKEGDTAGGGTITGTITVAGKPAVKASIVATDERGEASGVNTETDTEGRFVAKGLKAGPVRIQVQTAEGNFRTRSGTLEKSGGTVVIDVAFGASRLTGVLVGADGKVTVSGAWVQAEVNDPKGEDGGWGRVRGFATSSNEGAFSFQGLDPGTYRLRITGNMGGYASKVTEPFALGDGEAKDVGRIQLAAGGGISGRVTNEQGSPLEGVGVSLENTKGEPVFLFSLSSTGSDGRYGLEGLEFGVYTVVFDKKGYAPARKSATVAGTGGASVDVTLKGGGAIAIAVEDEQGGALADVRLELYENGKRVEKTLTIANLFEADVSRTNAQGATTIADLASATYAVKAFKDGYTLLSDPPLVTVVSGGVVPLKLVLRKGW